MEKRMIHIYKPYLPKDAFEYAIQAMESTWISSQGKFHDLAQEKLENLFGMKSLLLCNGTAGVHLMAKAIRFKYPNIKNIIVPNNVFISAITGFLYDQQFKLIACEADIESWNYNLSKLDILLKDAIDTACLIVGNIGNVVDVVSLKQRYPHIIFVEDNCEAAFGYYQNKLSGTEGFCSTISFYGNKSISSGEGGALFIQDNEVYDYLYQTHNCGQSKTRFVHNVLGHNYRMTNVQAAILLKQLEYLPEIRERKTIIFDKYRKEINNIDGCYNQITTPHTLNANWMFGLRIDDKYSKGFGHADQFFKKNGVEIRSMFYPLQAHPFLVNNPLIDLGQQDVAIKLHNNCIILPSFPDLTEAEQGFIINLLKEYLHELQQSL
jgi:perosamine synthetase